jgi:Arc/MetJ-type ribon-helix-helix transcriptional regulator
VAGMEQDEKLTERIIVPLAPSMVDDIKTYWHEHRFDSRADAIRHLLAFALAKSPSPKKK